MSENKEKVVFNYIHSDMYDKELKVKYIDFKVRYISKKEMKDSEEEFVVVGYVNAGDKKIKNDTYGVCNVTLDEDNSTQLNVYEKLKFKTTAGYIFVGINDEGKKECLEIRDTPIVIFILFPVFVGIIAGLLLTQCGVDKNPGGTEPTQKEELSIADGDAFDGEIDNGYRAPEVSNEQIKIQGKSTIYIREGGTVDLVNPEDNTVLFQYKVIMDGEVIYQMEDWIMPGQKVAWNAYEQLNVPGEYTISYQISTKDVDTYADCNAVNINGITAIVE